MNTIRFSGIFMVICLMCSFNSNANGLSLGGKSAVEVFKDERVVDLLRAAFDQNAPLAKQILIKGADINAIGEKGMTPLLWVEFHRDMPAMRILLDLGADPNKFVPEVVGETGFGSPVWIAAAAGQIEPLKILLEKGGNPNLAIGGKSPLMMALTDEHMDCAELLLTHGADINFSDGPMSALSATLSHVRFKNAVWVLNHGYKHDLQQARRIIVRKNPRSGEEGLKAEALDIVDRLIAAQLNQ